VGLTNKTIFLKSLGSHSDDRCTLKTISSSRHRFCSLMSEFSVKTYRKKISTLFKGLFIFIITHKYISIYTYVGVCIYTDTYIYLYTHVYKCLYVHIRLNDSIACFVVSQVCIDRCYCTDSYVLYPVRQFRLGYRRAAVYAQMYVHYSRILKKER
jgi:hypothetical protein